MKLRPNIIFCLLDLELLEVTMTRDLMRFRKDLNRQQKYTIKAENLERMLKILGIGVKGHL